MPSPDPRRLRPLPGPPIRWAILVLALGLCTAAAQAAPTSAPSEIVDLLRLEARAHAAASLSAAGRTQDAGAQIDHAAHGPLAALPADGGSDDLRAGLGRLRAAVEADDGRAVREATARLDTAIAAGLGGRLDGPAAVQVVLVALVREAGREGLEAANAPAGPAATEPQAYASALAAAALDLAKRHGASPTTRDAVTTLGSALGAPGAAVGGADVIRSATDNALAAMGVAPSAPDTARLFAAIDHDLDLAVARYRGGNADGAREALIDAYLENFEDLEPPLEAAAPDLKERLEHTLRDTLRSLLAQGVAPDRFEAAVEAARNDLERARQVLK